MDYPKFNMWEGPGKYLIISGLCGKTRSNDYNACVVKVGHCETIDDIMMKLRDNCTFEHEHEDENSNCKFCGIVYDTGYIDSEDGPIFALHEKSTKLIDILDRTGHIIS